MTDQPDGVAATFADALFAPEPSTWGLRGDPWVWRAMHDRLAGVAAPTTEIAAIELIHQTFTDVVGVGLNDDPTATKVYRPEFDHGGMSGGGINLDIWRTKLIPLLEQRAESYFGA